MNLKAISLATVDMEIAMTVSIFLIWFGFLHLKTQAKQMHMIGLLSNHF